MNKTKPVTSTNDLIPCLAFIRHKKQEHFVCLSLDSNWQLIKRRIVTIGLLDVSLAHPREVFAGPLKDRASAVVIAHNHPSGVAEPSSEDIKTTQQLVAAGHILGIPVRDHIIMAANRYYSFADKGLI